MKLIPTKTRLLTTIVLSLALLLTTYIVYENLYKELTLQQKTDNATTIFMKLQKHTDLSIVFTSLIIVDTPMVNAWTNGSYIAITTGMLKFLHNNDEIAFVLGHELGHVLLGHTSLPDDLGPQIHESNADKYGAYLAIRAGYDICAGKKVWDRMIEKYGAMTASSDDIHPGNVKRADDLNFPQCRL